MSWDFADILKEMLKIFQSLAFLLCSNSTFLIYVFKKNVFSLACECEISDNIRKNLEFGWKLNKSNFFTINGTLMQIWKSSYMFVLI